MSYVEVNVDTTGLLGSTHRRKRLATCGSGCENDVRVVILIYTEKALERRVIANAARDLKPMMASVETTLEVERGSQHTASGYEKVSHAFDELAGIANGIVVFCQVSSYYVFTRSPHT